MKKLSFDQYTAIVDMLNVKSENNSLDCEEAYGYGSCHSDVMEILKSMTEFPSPKEMEVWFHWHNDVPDEDRVFPLEKWVHTTFKCIDYKDEVEKVLYHIYRTITEHCDFSEYYKCDCDAYVKVGNDDQKYTINICENHWNLYSKDGTNRNIERWMNDMFENYYENIKIPSNREILAQIDWEEFKSMLNIK